MKREQHFDIFVSYRRTSFDTANLIATKLQMAGYSVFFDVETLRSGKFNERLFEVIEQCKDFVLVLPPNALDRCNDEGDWVRLEVEHAMKHGKNIIPVMLRGFEWPAAETLPESLRELPKYNAITAADPQVFAENMERLKRSFLVSRTKTSWQKYRMVLYFVCAVVIGIVCFVMLGRNTQQTATSEGVGVKSEGSVSNAQVEQVCADYALMIFGEYAKCDINMTVIESAYKEWLKFVENYDEAKFLEQVTSFEKSMESYRLQLMAPEKIVITDADEQTLRDAGIKKSVVSGHNLEFGEFYKETNRFIDTLIDYAWAENPALLLEFSAHGLDTRIYSLEMCYYSMLHTFSEMPASIYDELYEVFPSLSYFANVPLQLPSEEYKRMSDVAYNKFEESVRRMSLIVNNTSLKTEGADICVERLAEAEAALDAAYDGLDLSEDSLITAADDKASARSKVERLVASIDNFEVAMRDYVDAMVEYEKTVNDRDVSEELEEQYTSIMSELYASRDAMLAEYEARGWGKYE